MMMCRIYTQTRMVMRILAIDPGFDRVGMAVVEGTASKPKFIWSDTYIPPTKKTVERLAAIFNSIEISLKTYSPNILAIETLFFNVNKKTALGVAEARGVILAVAGIHSVSVVEYSPQTIKLAVTGYGGAKKDAVMRMVKKLIVLPEKNRIDDEFDALALGITALSNKYPRV